MVVEISANAGLSSAFQSGVQGLKKASDSITQSSQNIAERTLQSSQQGDKAESYVSSSQATSVTDDLVQLKVGEIQAQANTRSIQTANQVVGTLIDEMA